MSQDSISIIGAFAEGLLSFFSPCVLPLLPVYLGYLSGNARVALSNGQFVYDRRKVMGQTVCFILGISAAFFLMGMALTAVGKTLANYQSAFRLAAGLVIIVLALVQFGLIRIPLLEKSGTLTSKVPVSRMSPGVAFVLGFLFSFTWTPCVGPSLASIILLAASSAVGYLYILVYALGFIVPFIILGLFTARMLNFLKDRKQVLPALAKIGAAILLLMGLYSGYLGIKGLQSQPTAAAEATDANGLNFVLNDIDGNRYRLADYQGKPIVVNYFATWCSYCQEEIEDLKKVAAGDPDIQVLGILEVSSETDGQIREYLAEKDFNYPILIDRGGQVGSAWGLSGYPTTFFIRADFQIYGYYPGYVGQSALEDTLAKVKAAGR